MGGCSARRPLRVVLAGVHTARVVAALAKSAPPLTAPPPLELVATSGGAWTPEEIAHVTSLVSAAHADREHWLLGDWLAAHVPVGIRGRKTGTGRTLGELARRVGVSHNHLRSIRDTAHSWPPETRVPAAPFHVHGAFRDGGRDRAWLRLTGLAAPVVALEASVLGRVIHVALVGIPAATAHVGSPRRALAPPFTPTR